MDCRDVAASKPAWAQKIDTRRMIATADLLDYLIEIEGIEEDEIADKGIVVDARGMIEVPVRFDVCPLCEGRGRHVNPSIDSHGLTREDFEDDPDFADNYFGGMYDVTCAECKGERVVPVPDESRGAFIAAVVERKIESDWEYARECVREREMGY